MLAETGLPARYYLPRQDVLTDLLTPTGGTTTCPFKGQASYCRPSSAAWFHDDNVVWSYETPIPAAAPIAGLMCFCNERVELEVSGQHEDGKSARGRCAVHHRAARQ